jgi:hypothetical protein
VALLLDALAAYVALLLDARSATALDLLVWSRKF